MNTRTTAILFGLLCGVLLLFGLLQWLGVRTPAQRKAASMVVLPSLYELYRKQDAPADGEMQVVSNAKYRMFDRVTIERPARDGQPAQTIDIVRRGSQWQIVAPHPIRTDTAAVHRLIDQVALAERDSLSDLPPDLAAYGLDQPSHVVRLHMGEKTYALSIGKPGSAIADPVTKEQRPLFYYALGSELPDTPMTVATSAIGQLLAPLSAFRERQVFTGMPQGRELPRMGMAPSLVREIHLGGTQRPPVALAGGEHDRWGRASQWRFLEPRQGEAAQVALDALSGELAGLRIARDEDFLRDGVADQAELDKYGLATDKALYAVTVKTGTRGPENVQTLLVGRPIPVFSAEQFPRWSAATLAAHAHLALADGVALPLAGLSNLAFLHGQESLTGGLYARLADSGSIFRLDGKLLPYLRMGVNDLRSRNLAALEPARLDAIDIEVGQETLRFRRALAGGTATAWELHVPGQGKLGADQEAVRRLIDALNQIAVTEPRQFLDPATPHLGLDRPAAVVTLWQEALEPPQANRAAGAEPAFKKDAKPAAKLTISPKFLLLPWGRDFGYVFVKRESGDLLPTLLGLPDPWEGRIPVAPQPQEEPSRLQPTRPVSYSLVELATGGRLHYRARALPHITPGQREELTVRLGGMEYQLKNTAKPGTEEAWQLQQPVPGASPAAAGLLHLLDRLPARLLASDQATDAQLEAYGLARPWLHLQVKSFAEGTAASREVLAFSLGQRTRDTDAHPRHFYARVEHTGKDGKPHEANRFVFLVPEEVAHVLDVELRDPAILPVVRGVPLTEAVFTWNLPDMDGKFRTVKLHLKQTEDAQKRKSWTVQSHTVNGAPAPAPLVQVDAEKVALLFNEGQHLSPGLFNDVRTPRFIIHNGKPAPEQRLDPASKEHPPELAVELKLSDKTARTLVFGAAYTFKPEEHPTQKDAYRLAWTPALPNAVFLLHERGLEGLLRGPDYFKPAAPTSGK